MHTRTEDCKKYVTNILQANIDQAQGYVDETKSIICSLELRQSESEETEEDVGTSGVEVPNPDAFGRLYVVLENRVNRLALLERCMEWLQKTE